jgi:hypothetical protein
LIDKSGRFRKRWIPTVEDPDGKPEFVIAWKDETSIGKDITITQQDEKCSAGKGSSMWEPR